jgi:hypothetical protein
MEADSYISYKEKYKNTKRKLRWLIYEHENFKEELKKSQQNLLQVSRDKSYLLDHLLNYETICQSSSEDEATALSSEEGEGVLEITRANDSPVPTEHKHKKSKMETSTAPGSLNQEETVPPITIKLAHSNGGRPGGKPFAVSASYSESEANTLSVTPTPKTLTSEMMKAIPTPLTSVSSKPGPVPPQLATKQQKPSGIKSLPAAPRLLHSIPVGGSRMAPQIGKLVTHVGLSHLPTSSPTVTENLSSGTPKLSSSSSGVQQMSGSHGGMTSSGDLMRGMGRGLMPGRPLTDGEKAAVAKQRGPHD